VHAYLDSFINGILCIRLAFNAWVEAAPGVLLLSHSNRSNYLPPSSLGIAIAYQGKIGMTAHPKDEAFVVRQS
jgi:hypothetical protein